MIDESGSKTTAWKGEKIAGKNLIHEAIELGDIHQILTSFGDEVANLRPHFKLDAEPIKVSMKNMYLSLQFLTPIFHV